MVPQGPGTFPPAGPHPDSRPADWGAGPCSTPGPALALAGAGGSRAPTHPVPLRKQSVKNTQAQECRPTSTLASSLTCPGAGGWLTQKTTQPPREPDRRFAPSRSAWLKFSWQRRWLETTTGCATRNMPFQGLLPLISPGSTSSGLCPGTRYPAPSLIHGRHVWGHSRRRSRWQGLKRKCVPATLTAAKGKQAADGRSLSTCPSVLRRKDVLMPATVWTSPGATLLSKVRWTRKEKGGRICGRPERSNPETEGGGRGCQRCSHFSGTEFRRQVRSSGIRWW